MESAELADIRKELEALVERRWAGGLTAEEEVRYAALTQREVDLLKGVVRP
jgi:hypothetical protein